MTMQPSASTSSNSGLPAAARKRAPGADMQERDWQGLVGGLLKFFGEEAAEPEHAADAGPRTLYASRPLANADDLLAWARQAGFGKTLRPEDVHVTVAFSKEPLQWPEADAEGLSVPAGGQRSVERLGDEGAVVLRFDSGDLDDRWRELGDAGASWDHPSYKPHVTFTMGAEGIDLSKIEPYQGPLEFGPEVFKEVEDRGTDWANKARESMIGDAFAKASGGGGAGDAALDDVADDGDAAGVMIEDPNGNVLLLRRSGAGDHPGEWCFPGGGIEPGETTASEIARREAREETGREPGEDLKLFNRAPMESGGTFHTFKENVQEQFEPQLNDEHDEHAWAHPDDLPEPLHPGLAQLFGAMGQGPLGGDAGLKGADLGAADSALRLAFDRDSVREFDKDGRMQVKVANISKACVNPYRGEEIPGCEDLGLDPDKIYYLFRDPEELAKAAPTFNGVQLLKRHKPVSADDHQMWDIVGTTGSDTRFEAPYLKTSLFVWTKDGINLIESDEQKELSCGYHYRPVMEPGTFEGQKFDGRMTDIVGNHVALVRDGRAGDEVVVGDSAEPLLWAAIEAAILETADI